MYFKIIPSNEFILCNKVLVNRINVTPKNYRCHTLYQFFSPNW